MFATYFVHQPLGRMKIENQLEAITLAEAIQGRHCFRIQSERATPRVSECWRYKHDAAIFRKPLPDTRRHAWLHVLPRQCVYWLAQVAKGISRVTRDYEITA